MTKTHELRLSDDAVKQVEKLAEDAVKYDTWMTPVVEPGDDLEDYGQFAMAHRGGWMSTSQYACLYHHRLLFIVDEQEEAGAAEGFAEPRLAIMEELTDIFWESWEQRARLYEAWDKFRKTRGMKDPGLQQEKEFT